MNSASAPIVVLVPGLWMPAWMMAPLARRLERAGYRCRIYRYRSCLHDFERNAARLAGFVRALGAPRVYLVGHSLGGVLAIASAALHGLRHVRRIVTLGSPYADCYTARVFAGHALGRWMLGHTLPAWLECTPKPAPEGTEVGVVAGTFSAGLGMLFAPRLPRPHDGVVTVRETHVPGMTDYVELRINHFGMLLAAPVGELVGHFLAEGRFGRVASAEPGLTLGGKEAP